LYRHHGIDLGDGRVVHYAGDVDGSKVTAYARVSSWDEFAQGAQVSVRPYAGNRDPEATVIRALSRVGESRYNLVFNNCEHYARWAVTGVHCSEQVTAASSLGASVAVPLVAANVGLSVVVSIGAVSNLSGPGIVSGLAAAGGVVGGGAVAGVAVLGLGPGALSATLINRNALRDDPDLPTSEREGRAVGRAGSYTGAAAGTIGAIWAISALGYPGLSGAGISSGLAAIGSVAGGGMAAGTALSIIAPAVGAALLAYIFYRIYTALSDPSGPVTPALG